MAYLHPDESITVTPTTHLPGEISFGIDSPGISLDLAKEVALQIAAMMMRAMIETLVSEAENLGYRLRQGTKDTFGLSRDAYAAIEPLLAQKRLEQTHWSTEIDEAEVTRLVQCGWAGQYMTWLVNALRRLGYVFVPGAKTE